MSLLSLSSELPFFSSQKKSPVFHSPQVKALLMQQAFVWFFWLFLSLQLSWSKFILELLISGSVFRRTNIFCVAPWLKIAITCAVSPKAYNLCPWYLRHFKTNGGLRVLFRGWFAESFGGSFSFFLSPAHMCLLLLVCVTVML